MTRAFAMLATLLMLLVGTTANAQTFPALTGRVVDGANILPDADEAALVAKLETLETATGRQLVVATVASLEGCVYRLWDEAATGGLPPFDPPEITEADLSALLLDCALWGVSDPATLKWVDVPPSAAVAEARDRLIGLGALDVDGRPTTHGRAIARLPLPPRLAHMLTIAAQRGDGQLAAEVAVLLSERGLGGGDCDLEVRLERWRRDRGKRASAAFSLARRWQQLVNRAENPGTGDGTSLAAIVALAYPDRLARRRGANGDAYISRGGREFRLDPTHPLAKSEWLAVAETQGAASGARILAAAALDPDEIEHIPGVVFETRRQLRFDSERAAVEARIERWLGAIRLASVPDPQPDGDAVAAVLTDAVRRSGLDRLPWPEAAQALRQRARFAGFAMLDDEALLGDLDSWLGPLIAGKRALSDISRPALLRALEARLGWDAKQTVDSLAPAQFSSPAGTHHDIDYDDAAGPSVTLRVQALFGLSAHPLIGRNRHPLRLILTSPAGRPIQMTQDLPGFWAGSWRDVAKQMRGEYPKHNWPDDPANALASLKTKKAQSRA